MTDQIAPTPKRASEPTTLGSIVSSLVAFAKSRGFSIEELEEILGVSRFQLFSPEARLPEQGIPHLMLALQSRNSKMPASIDFAASTPLQGVVSVAYSARFGRTLRDAFELMVRNRRFMSDRLTVQLSVAGDHAAFVVSHPSDKIDHGLMNQAALALVRRAIDEVLGVRLNPVRAEIKGAVHGDITHYEAHFKCPLDFETARTALVFAARDLELKLPSADTQLYEFADIYFQSMTRKATAETYPPALSALVQAIAENAAKGVYTTAAAARTAQLGPRSAQRLARENGTTLTDLVTEARVAQAKHFLADPHLSVHEIAFLTGYSDDRAFRRAFKSWTGQSPSAFRGDLPVSR